jgi:hypothetical protein
MNKLPINKTRLAHRTAGTLIVCAAVLTVSALLAQSPTPTPPPQWPSLEKRPKVKQGFTNVLNRSAKDADFRKLLMDFTKPDLVRGKVQEELNKVSGMENEVIPREIIIIFYEPQKKGLTTESQIPKAVKDFLDEPERENRNYHVFYLPDYNLNDTAQHTYDVHIMCCYLPW